MGTRKQEYLDTLGDGLDQASQPVQVIEPVETVEYVTLSTGVVLHIRPIAPRIILQVLEKFKAPQVPVVYDKEKERSIENPQSPEYLKAMQKFQEEQGFAMLDACIALGTELHDMGDSGLSPIEQTDWIDELEAAGLTFATDRPRIRYTMWIKAVVATREEDLLTIVRDGLLRSGVTQEDVSSALSSFRS